jgi:hypothetical protein
VLAAALLGACASGHSTKNAAGHQPADVGGTSTTSASAGATVTKNRVFAPFDRSGAPAAGVAAHRSGSCFTTSITVAASDAYRCFAGNEILDPCFAGPASTHQLACYRDPWSRATVLRVRTLPSPMHPLHITRPWAIMLAGGMHCVVTNGTTSVLRGIPMGYACADGFAGMRPGGGADRSALYRATDGLVRVVRVVEMWRVSGP